MTTDALSANLRQLADERDYRGILAHLHGFAQTADPNRLRELVLAVTEEALPHLNHDKRPDPE